MSEAAAPATPKLARFAWAVLAWNVATIVWGTYVRASKSGAGCGDHWPFCQGHMIPSLASAATRIELFHRATSGLANVLIFACALAVFRARPKGDPARRAAATASVLIVVEDLLGAGLVVLRYVNDDASVGRAVWMAMHLVNTFLLLASLTLTAFHASGGPRFAWKGGVRTAMGFALGCALVTAAFGAEAALADTLFPARSLVDGLTSDLSSEHFLLRLRVIHPIVAMLLAAVIFTIANVVPSVRPSRASRAAAWAVTATLVLQLALGFVNVGLLAPIWVQLWHLANADLLWVSLVLLTASALAAPPRAAAARAAA